jgi:hypothetical protein
MAQQNRFAEAIIAAIGTAANLFKITSFPMGPGELAFSSDTYRLYVARSQTGGNFARVHGLDLIVTSGGDVVVSGGQVVWSGEFS